VTEQIILYHSILPYLGKYRLSNALILIHKATPTYSALRRLCYVNERASLTAIHTPLASVGLILCYHVTKDDITFVKRG
jgi:hypothetical protein